MPNSIEEGLVRPNLYSMVADKVIELIAREELQAGDTIGTQLEISERFRVGRSSVREALRILESRGVIRAASGGQFVVGDREKMLESPLAMLAKMGLANLAEITVLRTIVENECAALAAVNRTDKHVADLEQLTEAMSAALGAKSHGDFLTADLAFHGLVAHASNNRALIVTSQGVRASVDVLVRPSFQMLSDAVTYHQTIADAIKSCDPAAARMAMQAHMDWVERIYEATPVAE
jgi:GntR family transcriptional repressor for pyruvate dehydrogenase complex